MENQRRDGLVAGVGQNISALRWQDILVIEASGIRSVAAVAVPLICGQLAGSSAIGMMIGFGGLQIAFADMPGAKRWHLFAALLASMAFFLLGVLASHVSVSLAILLMFLVAFVMSMLAAFGNVVGNIGFVTTITYAFAEHMPISLKEGGKAVVLLGLGGIWAISLTLLLWRVRAKLERRKGEDGSKAGPLPESIAPPEIEQRNLPWHQALRQSFALLSPVFQHAIRTAIATAIAVAIAHVFHVPHGYWLALTTMVILKPDYAATRRRIWERVLGSIIGGLAAMLPVAYTQNVVVLDALLVVMGILAFSHLPRNYGLYVIFLTPFIVFMTTVAAPADHQVALARIYETMIGGAIAFAIAFFLRSPRHWMPRATLPSTR